MKGLEFMTRVSIGRYVEADSPVHRLGPATKYLWLLALMTVASLSRSAVVIALAAILALAFARLASVGLGFLLRGILPIAPFLALAALFQILFTWPGDGSPVLLALGPVSLTLRELLAVGMMALRFVAVMVTIGLFTSVTSEGDTARGVEDLLAPLSRFGFPARALALTVAVAFRFIPIIASEFESVVKAQAARGADFGSSSRGPIRKARAYLPLIVPVTIRALERAEALAEAMEARCYGTGPASRYVETAGGRVDAVVSALAVSYAVLSLALAPLMGGA